MVSENQKAIGIFDSGLGGLTVYNQIARLLPHEHLIYFGDTARVPYGNKSPETIIRYALESAQFLMEQQIKCLVVGCNTVSAYALPKLRQFLNIPVLGVIQPGVESLLACSMDQGVGVLGTRATIESGIYQRLIQEQSPNCQVKAIACPLLVPLVEEQMGNHPATRLILEGYLSSLRNSQCTTVLLGCTHYPLIRHIIQEVLGDSVRIIDSAKACAQTLTKVLKDGNLQATHTQLGDHRFYVSDDPNKFCHSATAFLGRELKSVLLVSLQGVSDGNSDCDEASDEKKQKERAVLLAH